jgi:hypothetical protein
VGNPPLGKAGAKLPPIRGQFEACLNCTESHEFPLPGPAFMVHWFCEKHQKKVFGDWWCEDYDNGKRRKGPAAAGGEH